MAWLRWRGQSPQAPLLTLEVFNLLEPFFGFLFGRVATTIPIRVIWRSDAVFALFLTDNSLNEAGGDSVC